MYSANAHVQKKGLQEERGRRKKEAKPVKEVLMKRLRNLLFAVSTGVIVLVALFSQSAISAEPAKIYVGDMPNDEDERGENISSSAISAASKSSDPPAIKEFDAIPGTIVGHGKLTVTKDGTVCENPPVTIMLPEKGKRAAAVIRVNDYCELEVVRPPRSLKRMWRQKEKEERSNAKRQAQSSAQSSSQIRTAALSSPPGFSVPKNGAINRRRVWVTGTVHDIIMLILTETGLGFSYYDHAKLVWNGSDAVNIPFASPFFPTWYVAWWGQYVRMQPIPGDYPSLYSRTSAWYNWRHKYYKHYVRVRAKVYPGRIWKTDCHIEGSIPRSLGCFFICRRGLIDKERIR